MIKLLGSRGASAVMGIFMLALGSSGASAQTVQPSDLLTAPRVEAASPVAATASPAVAMVRQAVTSAATTVSSVVTSALGTAQPSPTIITKPDMATEAAWLHRNGWHLEALVDRYAPTAAEQALDEQSNCIAVAIYHEARGESVEGQLAVARVIMNRTASSKYPPTWCGTVNQPWQFSFVNPRTGHIPYIDTGSKSWRKAVAITKLATGNAVPSLTEDVLWYHADYVAPSWGRRLTRVNKIGTHIFYRA